MLSGEYSPAYREACQMTNQTAQLIAAAREGLQLRLASVAAPADAVLVTAWEDDGDGPFRQFDGRSWSTPVAGDFGRFGTAAPGTPDIAVAIRGAQFGDGSADRWVALRNVPEELPAETVEALSGLLAAASTEIERYSS